MDVCTCMGHYHIQEANSVPKAKLEEIMSFEEQIMSNYKCLSIFLKSNGGYCVYCLLNIFFNTRGLPVCDIPIMSKIVNWLPNSPRL